MGLGWASDEELYAEVDRRLKLKQDAAIARTECKSREELEREIDEWADRAGMIGEAYRKQLKSQILDVTPVFKKFERETRGAFQ